MGGRRTKRDRWIDWVLRQHRSILAAALVLTAIAGVLAARLEVDGDLRRLLPRDHEVVENLEEIEATFGSTGSVNVVVRGTSVEARHAFTRALSERLEGHELLRDVDYRLPSAFFSDHALYYLSDAEIEELDQRIQAWIHAEFCTESPDSCVTKPEKDAREKLERFVEDKREDALDRTGFRDFYEREGIDANVILLHPNQPAAALEFSTRLTDQMRATVAEVRDQPGTAWAGTDLIVNLVGPYINKVDDWRIIKRDMLRAGLVAFTGVVLVLYLLFRSVRAVLVLVVPLSCGVVWSLAATYLVIGDLNGMTSMISTVVMGAGIDAGIHFFVRARKERRKHDNDAAIRNAFGGLIIPLLVASSTTIGAFAIMATSKAPGFREFGVIAAMGVALCLLAMTTVLPALSHVVGVKRSEKPPRPSQGALSRLLLARPGVLLTVLAVLTAIAALGVRQIGFEYNGRKLQSDHTREASEDDVALISEIFGRDIHAGILVRASLEDSRLVLDRARARRKELGEASVVAELFGLPDLLPDPGLDQAARRERIEALLEEDELEELEEIAGIESELRKQKQLEDGGGGGGDDDWDDEGSDDDGGSGAEADNGNGDDKLTADDAGALIKMMDAQPFTVDDLPAVLLRRVRTEGGEYGVFAYPAFDAADMRKGVEFIEETSSYLPENDEGMFVGETTVYAAMFTVIQEEAPVVLGMAALLVALLVYWQLRSVRQALMCLLPLVIAFWWLIGVMGAIDLQFTLFNLPILPAVLGIGVDNGVYLTDRIRRTKGEPDGLLRSLQETGSAIMAAMATTAIGFAAFMVADSAGVRGVGAVAVLGIVLAAFAATLVLPAISGLARGVAARRR